ncbi:MAG: outer membrane lipoprotein-sorting protein [Bdellovibrionia bacterium]
MNNKSKLAALVLSLSSLAHAATPSATDLLKSADRARGGLVNGLEWTVNIESVEDGDKSNRTFQVRALDINALVQAVAPARNKGEVFLFNDHDLWFARPGLKKPVAISARQRLTGQAANGDIASTHYSRDYSATVESKGAVNGEPVTILKLKAKDPKVTYDQIRYFVSDKRGLALKAEFMTLQGEVMKTATFEYGNQIASGSEHFPFVSKMTIRDAKIPENVSVIQYTDPQVKATSPSLFNVNNLTR